MRAAPVRTLVARALRPWDANHRVVHGTVDPDEIAAQIDDLCRRATGHPAATGLFHRVSIGSVTGVRLDDGRAVVVKAYQPIASEAFVAQTVDLQRRLAERAFPCARPIAGPLRTPVGWATVEELHPDPGPPRRYGPAHLRASAEGFAALIELLPPPPPTWTHPYARSAGALYPAPHAPHFDLGAPGGEWIDDHAQHAAGVLATNTSPLVLAHQDFSASNVRLRARGLVAVYDLDSIAAVPEAAAAGAAAAVWRTDGAPGGVPLLEIEDWLDHYPRPLERAGRRIALAAVLHQWCYSARCEHSADPDGHTHVRSRVRLRADGPKVVHRLEADGP
jgi:hypothetical protein